MTSKDEKLEEAIEYQIKTFEIYKAILKEDGLAYQDIKKIIKNKEYWRIPSIDAEMFKRSRNLYLDLANTNVEGIFHCSSSTSGDPSLVYLSYSDLEYKLNNFSQSLNVEECSGGIGFAFPSTFSEKVSKRMKKLFSGLDNYKLLPVMFFGSLGVEKNYEDLHYYVTGIKIIKTIANYLKGNKRPVYNYLSNDDLYTIIKKYEEKKEPIMLGGFVLLLYSALKGLKDHINKNFNLGNKAYIVTGAGGWSGVKGIFKGEKINKQRFVEEMCELFNIDRRYVSNNFRDMYAFTESPTTHLGFFDIELGDYKFKPHPDSMIYIINKNSGEPVNEGEEGVIKVITFRKIEGSPTVVVQQHDVARLIKKGKYEEALEFTNIHREKGYKPAGCSLKAAELLRKE